MEYRLGRKIDADWAITELMVPHACVCINRFLVGRDGKTAMQRNTGKAHTSKWLECGEQVWAKPKRKTKVKAKPEEGKEELEKGEEEIGELIRMLDSRIEELEV